VRAASVKPALTRKRAKRVRENSEYASFARRVVAGYARRVADGDIEALTSLALFASDVDRAVREAVQGLRRWGYSWDEIGLRLGVTRQAAQMRYGQRNDRDVLDQRLLDAGIGVTVDTLVAIFADHHPGRPQPPTCPGCGHRYRDDVRDCPTLATVRTLLYARRHEAEHALARLTPDQYADLHDRKVARANRAATRRAARPDVRSSMDALPALPLTPQGH
jgi:hypothetical protein